MVPTIGKVILHKAPVALVIALPLLHVLLWGAARDKVFLGFMQALHALSYILTDRKKYKLSPVRTHISLYKLSNLVSASFRTYGVLSSGGV